jgi:cytochrome c biogenesis protein CcmG, thiol:disulfide interchange protein DsbE
MTRSVRLMLLALLLAAFGPVTSGVAADLDALMKDFRVTPSGLKPAPAFNLKTLEGKPAALADHRGRPVLVYFWATW